MRKIERERRELSRIEGEIKEYDLSIIQVCTSLGTYGVPLDSNKLLKNDYSELNRLLEKVQPDQKDETTTLHIVDDMIAILQRYGENTVVPLVEKSVRETLKDLYRLKVKLSSDRVLTLAKLLRKTIEQKKMALIALSRVQERVGALQQKRRDLEGFKEIEDKFIESEKRYIALQTALQENKGKMLDKWEELRSVKGDSTELRSRLQELEVRIRTEENMKAKYEENLRNLRENATEKPKYEDDENNLRSLNERVSKIRENLYQWTQILSRPTETRKEFESTKERSGFGLSDYQVFVKSVGEYLGEQFEPILYDYKLHKIKFFDIEKRMFVTDTDRKIPIDKLSQGQSKLATLTGTFKKMDPNKRKIVLIDEIADLDPENLQHVKNTLKSRFEDGSLMLTVLVRPTRESSKMLEFSGWG
jgi:chromosome segregation ATPase